MHDLAVLREPSWFPAWSRNYGRTLMPRAVRNADRVICVSRATARDAVGLLDVPYRKLRVIPNAIEPVFSSRPGPPPLEPPYLLCVGTPEPRKNLPALLEAFTLVRRAGRRVRLALVGADGWGDVRVGSTEGVVAFGRVDDTELRDLYAHAEALVLPSLWEGFGLPVAEALATGCRVACSNIPALRELAGEDATYFDPSIARGDLRGHPARAHPAAAGAAPRLELGRRRGARSSRSGASSCRERAARSSWSTPTPSGVAAPGDESYTDQPPARAAGRGAGLGARVLAARPRRPARRTCPPAVRRLRLDVANPYRRIPVLISRRSRGARTRRSPTRTTSSRRACAARPS